MDAVHRACLHRFFDGLPAPLCPGLGLAHQDLVYVQLDQAATVIRSGIEPVLPLTGIIIVLALVFSDTAQAVALPQIDLPQFEMPDFDFRLFELPAFGPAGTPEPSGLPAATIDTAG